MKKWDYAELSKAAKAVGGPEKYIELLEKASRQKGRNEMLPWIGVAAAGASLLTAGAIQIFNIFKAKSNKEEEIEEIKKDLIEGIKKYDANDNEAERGGEENEREISEY